MLTSRREAPSDAAAHAGDQPALAGTGEAGERRDGARSR